MGGIFSGRISGGSCLAPTDPDPIRFVIRRYMRRGDWAALLVHYPNCTNYEGVKILVIKGVGSIPSLDLIPSFVTLDPHFMEGGNVLARFLPNDWGWSMAEKLVTDLWYDSIETD